MSKVEKSKEDKSKDENRRYSINPSKSPPRQSKANFDDISKTEESNNYNESDEKAQIIRPSLDFEEEEESEEESFDWCCGLTKSERIFGLKVSRFFILDKKKFFKKNYIYISKTDTLTRLFKVCLAFPFVIVVSSLNLSNKYTFLRYYQYQLFNIYFTYNILKVDNWD